MCGLVGVAGNLQFKDEALMKRLFLLDYFRGPDSTGLAAIQTNGDAVIAKIDSNPLTLFEMKRFTDALNGYKSKAFIGHNRAATRGAVNVYNAHPFHFDHIVGAHNGTLDSASVDRLQDAVGEKFNVDSQVLFAAIAKLGIKETISLCTEGRDYQTGAWALTWFDQNEGTINFLRNKHRPLWYAWTKDFKRLLWASEWPMISHAVEMSGDTFELFAEEHEDPAKRFRYFHAKEDTHYRFDVATIMAGGDKRPKAKVQVLKGREPAMAVSTTKHNPFDRSHNPTGFHSTRNPSKKNSSTTTSLGTSAEKTVLHLIGDENNPYAGFVTPSRFQELAKYGCSWCQETLEFSDPGVTIYERDDMILCRKCSGFGDVEDHQLPYARIYTDKGTIQALN